MFGVIHSQSATSAWCWASSRDLRYWKCLSRICFLLKPPVTFLFKNLHVNLSVLLVSRKGLFQLYVMFLHSSKCKSPFSLWISHWLQCCSPTSAKIKPLYLQLLYLLQVMLAKLKVGTDYFIRLKMKAILIPQKTGMFIVSVWNTGSEGVVLKPMYGWELRQYHCALPFCSASGCHSMLQANQIGSLLWKSCPLTQM